MEEGFPSTVGFMGEEDETTQVETTKKKKSGGFESMGLTTAVFQGIKKKGYRVPTPIQRRVIPLVMANKDVVAMARTGSGKTGAFLIPILERLASHSSQVGVRSLILSPTRELALQTLKFAKELGRFTDLRLCILVGGKSMDDQFEALSRNPDIIIATPGRLVHHMVEVQLSLKHVESLVFDEADRMFEMGFEVQLRDILKHVSPTRQTLLFSATIPEQLASFARAGLHDPELVRLDADTKISPDLQIQFFAVRREDKDGALLYLLRNLITRDQRTIVFAATRHHSEYLSLLLTGAHIPNASVYGSMDQTARTQSVASFSQGHVQVLLVTDVAARGIDIPLLDAVINYDFPAKPKLFVHRVGRTARAGRSGVAYSLVCSDELPYMVDLHLFLGRRIQSAPPSGADAHASEVYFGCIPDTLLAPEVESARQIVAESCDLTFLTKTVSNAYKLYYKTRPSSSPESCRRGKALDLEAIHPLLVERVGQSELDKITFMKSLRTFRPGTSQKGARATPPPRPALIAPPVRQDPASEGEEVFAMSSGGGVNTLTSKPTAFRDESFFMAMLPSNHDQTAAKRASTLGYAGSDSTKQQLEDMTMDLAPDEGDGMMKKKSQMRWDVRKKKYVMVQLKGNESILERAARAKNESGATIKADGKRKKSLYEEWKKKKRSFVRTGGEEEMGNEDESRPAKRVAVKGGVKSELKSEHEIRQKRNKRQQQKKSKEQLRVEKEKFLAKRVARKASKRAAPTRSKMIKRR